MRIGELARRAGVSASRVRFYEARGVLAPAARLANGYRDYGDDAVQVLAFIARGQSLGFTLRDIVAHLRSPEGPARKARLQGRLEAKAAELDAQIGEMCSRRAAIRGLIEEVRVARAERLPTGVGPMPDADRPGP